MASDVSEQYLESFNEVLDQKSGLNRDQISMRYARFEELVNCGAIHQEEPLYMKMRMVGAHLQAIQGNFPQSLKLLLEVLAIAQKLQNRDWELRALNNIALVRQALGDIFEAIGIWESLLEEELSEADRVLYTNNLGVAYNKALKPKAAIDAYLAALSLLEKSGETEGAADIYNNLANLHRAAGSPEKALEYLLCAKELYANQGNNERLAMIYNNLCACYTDMTEVKPAEQYAEMAMDYYARYMPEHQMSIVLNNLASLKTIQKDYATAIKIYRESLDLAEKYHDDAMEITILNNLALIGIEEADYDSAIECAQRARDMAHKTNNMEAQKTAYSMLKDAWQYKHDFAQAFLAQSVEMILEHRIHKNNTPLHFAQAESKYLQSKLESQLEMYQTQNIALEESNQIIRRKTAELVTKNNLLLATNSLLNRIISIIAHDVRGPVATISQTAEFLSKGILKEQHDDMLKYLNQSARDTEELISELLEIAGKYKAGLEEEPEVFELNESFRSGIKLAESTAYPKGISVNFQSNCDPLMIRLVRNRLKLIVRNLMSNAIKFSHPGSTITLELNYCEPELRISIQDQGIGMSSDQIERILTGKSFSMQGTMYEKGFGMGLVFVLEAILHTGGRLEISSKPSEGSRFTIIYKAEDILVKNDAR
ncbi:MAG: tetratricopeptide repeat protein [Candidatus Cloacimonadaceae bacterium]|nr:tetratricopeptide repeat-containing sensor histidine kinase [Candidatus Cloacimonadota bacterium]